jgi:hypothetical protein
MNVPPNPKKRPRSEITAKVAPHQQKMDKKTVRLGQHMYTVKTSLKRNLLQMPLFKDNIGTESSFIRKVNEFVGRVTQITYEAWLFANMLCLRGIALGKPMVLLDNSTFYACIRSVSSVCKSKGTFNSPKYANKSHIDEVWWRDAQKNYLGMRSGANVVSRDQLDRVLNYSAQQMSVVATNHIEVNLYKRIFQFCRLKFGTLGIDIAHERNALAHEVAKSLWKENVLQVDLEHKVANAIFQELKGVLQNTPVQDQDLLPIRFNSANTPCYLYLLHHIATQYPTDHKKGHFTILPTSGTFKPLFITLDHLGVRQILSSIKLKQDGVGPSLMRQVFDMASHETPERKFQNLIQTDGVALNISMAKPIALRDSIPKEDFNPLHHEKEYVKRKRENDTLVASVRLRSNMHIIGVDPGRISMFTAADYIPNTGEDKFESREYSTARYWSECGYKQRHARMLKHQQNNFQIDALVKALPMHKTCKLGDFETYVKYVVPHLSTLLDHFGKKKCKSWKFEVHAKQKKAMYQACKVLLGQCRCTHADKMIKKYKCRCRISPKNVANIVVAFGNANFNPCSKGHEPGPTVALKKALNLYDCTVVDVDEFKTSQVCCLCHIPLLNDVAPRAEVLSEKTHLKRQKLVERKEKIREMLNLSPTSIYIPKTLWSVRRCVNNLCRVGSRCQYWNRDVSAAFNIATCLATTLYGNGRPPSMCRTSKNNDQRD